MTHENNRPTLATAFRTVRAGYRPANVRHGYTAPLYHGVSYRHDDDGIGLAVYAVREARRRLTTYRNAVALLETVRAIRDDASPEDKPEAERIARDESRHVATLRQTVDATPEDNRPGGWSPETPGLYHFNADDCGPAVRDCRDAQDVDGGPSHGGWFDNPHGESFRDGDGLCVGVVVRLRARGGREQFAPGYVFKGHGGGPAVDFRQVTDCEREAARVADSMAEHAAEREREYQTAWAAGQAYADAMQEAREARESALFLLAERRELKRNGARDGVNVPAICRAIRDSVTGWRADIAAARERMAELAAGDAEGLWFYPGKPSNRDAFTDGANLSTFPA